MTTPHPEFETLAELADQAGDAPEPATGDQQAAATAEVLAHVAECATCQADLDALRSVRETLRSLPPVPMPADVAERLDAALLAARAQDSHSADVVPINTRPARGAQRNPFPYSAAAAVLAVLALGGGLVFAITKGGGDSKKSSASTAASATSGPRLTASGTDYTTDSLRQQVATLVNGTVPGAAANYPGLTNPDVLALGAAAPAASASAAATTAGSSAAAAGSAPFAAASSPADASGAAGAAPRVPAPTRTAPTGPLADPAALQRCVTTLLGKYEQPVLVDYANFNGVPSTILVLPDPDVGNKLDIYVEADTADCAKEDITAVEFLPASAAP